MRDGVMHTLAFLATGIAQRGVLTYRDEASTEWMLPGGVEEVRARLVARLRMALDYARSANPYYAERFASGGFDPLLMDGLEDIGSVPVLTKDDIVRHRADFQRCESRVRRRVQATTGGSTGQPLKFSMSQDDYRRSIGVGLAGWGLAGYRLGDRMAVLGGASLVDVGAVRWRSSVSDLLLNRRQLSVVALNDDQIVRYWDYIEHWKPSYVRGYPFALAQFCRERPAADTRQFRPRAVFTTSETLTDVDRAVIESTLGAPVFDGWGLNDGGAAAYECTEHKGMHVDTTRAYVETVDEMGRPVWDVPGRIVVTSLTNKAFPFVRYDTGDAGVLTWRDCGCGRSSLVLAQVLGRADERLDLGGVKTEACASSWLRDTDRLRRWHIVQDAPLHVAIMLDVDPGFDRQALEEAALRSFRSRNPNVSITFVYKPLPLPADGSKWKSVVVLESARAGMRPADEGGDGDAR